LPCVPPANPVFAVSANTGTSRQEVQGAPLSWKPYFLVDPRRNSVLSTEYGMDIDDLENFLLDE
jgi:hypothetical protein